MAPLRNRAHRVQNDQDQMIEGLPIRNWRRLHGNIGAPIEEQPIVQLSRWPELPMPRDSNLLSDMSRQLLRLARLPRASKPFSATEENNKENPAEEEAKKPVDPKGFQIRKWSQMAKDWNPPDRDYVAKRRKGLPAQEGFNSLYGPEGQSRAFRMLKVKRIDGDGISHVYQVMAPVGVAVEGELPETDGGLSGPLEPRQPPGTIIDGIGIANEEGIIVAQPTPTRRRGPPPPRKKKRFFGRNKKRIETEYGPDGLPVHPPGPSDLITRPDGAQGEDTQTQDNNDHDNDDEDEEGSGDEQEEGEEGEEGEGEGEEGDDDEHEYDEHDEDNHGEAHDRDMSSSATPAPVTASAGSLLEPTRGIEAGEADANLTTVLGPSSLRTEIQIDSETIPTEPAEGLPAEEMVADVPMDDAPPTVQETVEAVLDGQIQLPATLEPEPIVEPSVPEIVPQIPQENSEPPSQVIANREDTAPKIVVAEATQSAVAEKSAAPLSDILADPQEPTPNAEIPQEPVIRPVDEQTGPTASVIEIPKPSSTILDAETTVLPSISEVVPVTLTEEANKPMITIDAKPPQPVEPPLPLDTPIATTPPQAPILQPVEPVFIPAKPQTPEESADAGVGARPTEAQVEEQPVLEAAAKAAVVEESTIDTTVIPDLPEVLPPVAEMPVPEPVAVDTIAVEPVVSEPAASTAVVQDEPVAPIVEPAASSKEEDLSVQQEKEAETSLPVDDAATAAITTAAATAATAAPAVTSVAAIIAPPDEDTTKE